MSSDEYRHPLIAVVDEHLDRTLERLDKGTEPLWQGQLESIRSIVTLSSSALILSVTLAQFLAGRIAQPRSTWLLPAAWILFLIALVVGGGNFSWLGAARTVRARFELKRGSIREGLRALDPDSDDFADKVDDIIVGALNDASTEAAEHHTTYVQRFHIMYWSFVLGLLGLIGFAVRNLPFPLAA